MCYSARVKQHRRDLSRRFGAQVDWKEFEALFSARLHDPGIKIARALEANFDAPETEIEIQIKKDIDAFRSRQEKLWEGELFKQKKRQADAERALKAKDTKKSREDIRISTEKITKLVERLNHLRRREQKPSDSQIFPMYYVSLIVEEKKQRWIRPMRYTCRLAGKPANYDGRFPGTYNARRDNLGQFWKALYGHRHGVMVINSFFENVPMHRYEKRQLAPGEKEKNIVLHFNPKPAVDMIVACLWDHWEGKGEPALNSFAAITDEPPPEIAATGHTRCVISLCMENLDDWLSPDGLSEERLAQILSQREAVTYEHRVAA